MGLFGNMRPGQPVTLTKGQPIPAELFRMGEPATAPSEFHSLPLAEQMKRIGQISQKGVDFQKNYYNTPDPGYSLGPQSGYNEGPRTGFDTGAAMAQQSSMPPGYMGGTGIGDGRIEREQAEMNQPPQGMGEFPEFASMPPQQRTGLMGSRKAAALGYPAPRIDGEAGPFAGVMPSDPEAPKKNTLRDIASILGPALLGFGNPALGLQASEMINRQRREGADRQRAQREKQEQWQREDDWKYLQRDWQVEDRDAKNKAPQYFMSGRDRVMFDPSTGSSETVFDGIDDFDNYAQSLGLEPGSDEYETAVTDYVLRGHGPTALGYDKNLDDYKTRNRIKVRGVPTYQQANPRPRAASSPRKAAPPVTAINPKTGEKLMVDSRGNWVPFK